MIEISERGEAMVIDAGDLNETLDIRASIAIIGGGPAGITLAIELAEQFEDVLLLESGGTDFEKGTQELYSGKVLGHKLRRPVLDLSDVV